MTYLKQFRDGRETVTEITKEQARRYLEGYWKPKFLDDIFSNDRAFRLWTPFSIIWTKDDNGLIPMAGFMGVVGE